MKHFGLLIFLAASTLSLTACPSKNKGSDSIETRIGVLGDPAELIRGAELDPRIDAANFRDGETLALFASYIFVEETPYSNKKRDAEAENATNKSSGEAKKAVLLNVRIEGGRTQLLTEKGEGLEIVYRNGEYLLNPDYAEEKTKVLHTSVSRDGNTISLLVYAQNKKTKRRQLMALYLTRNIRSSKKLFSENSYEYYSGTGIKLPWPKKKPIDIGVCNNSYSSLNRMTDIAVSEWQSALGNKLKFSYQGERKSYPPFSDLNHRCIYVVDAYRTEPSPHYANFGSTTLIPDMKKGTILDSDILLFKNEFAKDPKRHNSAHFSLTLMRVVLHEIGHFLGLGHQFNGTKSVMSYDMASGAKIEYHDIEAIRALYE